MAAKNDILRDKDGNQIFPATVAEQVSYDGKINVKQAIKRGAVRNKVAPTVASMTDKEQIYVYTGTEEGYTFGNWYYWDGTAWTSGGAYNAIEVNTDGTLTEEGAPADAKATGDKLSELKDDLGYLIDYQDVSIKEIRDYYISSTDGSLVSNGVSVYADISVIEGEVYVLETVVNNSVRSAYALYDSEMNLIRTEAAGNSTEVSTYRIEIPSGCLYMRIGKNGTDAPMVLKKCVAVNDTDIIINGGTKAFGKQANVVSGYASANNTNIFYYPMPHDGFITNIEINCSAEGNVDVYKFKRIGETQYVRHTGFVGSYEVSQGYNSIDCVACVEKDEMLGFFGVGSVGIGYANGNSDDTFIYVSGIGNGRDIFYYGVNNKYLACRFTYKLKNLFEREINNKNGGCLIDTEYVINEDLEYSTGWSSPFNSSSENSYVSYKNPSGMDEYVGHIKFTTEDVTSKFAFCQFDDGGYYVSVDFGNDVIKIHKQFDGVDYISGETYVQASTSISDKVDIVASRQYVVEVEQDSVKKLTVTLTDAQTMQSVSLEHICVKNEQSADYNSHGKGRYPFAVILKKGNIAILNFKIYTKMPTKPLLMIYGDSFCEGFNLIRYGFECEKRYPQLIKNALNGNVAISAKGGESTTGLVEKLDTDFTLFKPKYTLIAMSINDSIVSQNSIATFKVNMTKLIEKTRANGSEPIIVTLPSMGNGADLIRQYNSWIKNYYLDIRYLDINNVLSVTTSDTPDISLFLEDGHPNVEGNERIFKKFMLDFSDIIADAN